MTEETRKALQLFIEKSDKLRSLGFLTAINELGFRWNTTKGEEKLEITGPTQEQIEAFILTFRFFSHGNEHSSLRWLANHVVNDPDMSEHSPPYTFFLLNGDMELTRNQILFV